MSGFSNLLFSKSFQISLKVAGITWLIDAEHCGALFKWSHAIVLLNFQYKNSGFPSKTTKSWTILFISCRHIPGTYLICRPDFLFETIAQLMTHRQKTKICCVEFLKICDVFLWLQKWKYRMKIIFLECKYFVLNANMFSWMQMYFLK